MRREKKRIIAFTLALSMIFANFTFGEVFGEELNNEVETLTEDVTPPVLEVSSLKVDKQEGTIGDRINITLKATDIESGINSVYISYEKPVTGGSKGIFLNYNAEKDLFEGYIDINENTVSGTWKIYNIMIKDNSNNQIIIYNSNLSSYGDIKEDLSLGDFTVTGTNADVTHPVLDVSSLRVDRQEVTLGDRVNISFKAYDEGTGIKYASVWYKTPISNNKKVVYLEYNSNKDVYEGSIYVDDSIELGKWQIDWIALSDNNENGIIINNTNLAQSRLTEYTHIKEDLSAGDFTVIEDSNPVIPVEGATVVTENETWSNTVINGDLYVGPNAVLKVDGDVTVTGNVYVLGALRSYGGLTIQGTLNGTNMSFGGGTLYNGTIIVSGSNSITSMSMSNYPVQDIPLRIDNEPLKSIDGKLDIVGATLDIADMYINDEAANIGYKGKLDLRNIQVGNKKSIDVKFKTVFGNEIKKSFDLRRYITLESGELNEIPEISGLTEATIKVGDEFDPLFNVTATDAEDGNISERIQVSGKVDNTKVGEYTLSYSVTDKGGASELLARRVIVRSNDKPVITGANNITIKCGDVFDSKDGVIVTDTEDGDITSQVKVEGNFDTSRVGQYNLIYIVTDSDNNETKVERVITVRSNEVPYINAQNINIKAGDEFNPLLGISAIDEEDGDITSKITVAENTVDITKAGEYKLVYQVTDSDNNTVTKEIKVIVEAIKTGWVKEAGKWYYFNESGEMHKGWLNLKGTWYYLKDNGEMATGWLKLGGTWYYLQPGGQMATGWLNLSGTWYYLQPGGQMATGWLNLGGTWYYLQPGGQMATGWQRVNGKWYYMNIYGAMETGWVRVNSSWYYLNAYGEMVTGWAYINSNWYYMYISGVMATNTVINGWKIDAYGIARQ